MLLALASASLGYQGRGDFALESDGRIRRRKVEQELVPFAFTGVSMAHPRLFDGSPDGAFSLNLVWSQGDRGGSRLRRAHGRRLDACRHAGRAGGSGAVPERCSSKLKESEGRGRAAGAAHLHGAAGPAVPDGAGRGAAGRQPAGARRPAARADAARRRDPAAADPAGDAGAAGGVPRGGAAAARCCCRRSSRIIGSGEEPTLFTGALELCGRRWARRRRPSARSSASWLLTELVLRWSEAERGGRGPEADIGEYAADGRPYAGAGRPAGARAGAADGRDGDRGRRLREDAATWCPTRSPRTGRRRCDFLQIVTEHWPAAPCRARLVSKMQRDKALVLAQARQWRKTPPDAPVIVAGVMSSVPGRDGAAAGRGRPAQRRAGAAGARPDARRGELADDRAGASRASAVRPQEAARCAGGAARGRAGRCRASRRRRPSAGARAW